MCASVNATHTHVQTHTHTHTHIHTHTHVQTHVHTCTHTYTHTHTHIHTHTHNATHTHTSTCTHTLQYYICTGKTGVGCETVLCPVTVSHQTPVLSVHTHVVWSLTYFTW